MTIRERITRAGKIILAFTAGYFIGCFYTGLGVGLGFIGG